MHETVFKVLTAVGTWINNMERAGIFWIKITYKMIPEEVFKRFLG